MQKGPKASRETRVKAFNGQNLRHSSILKRLHTTKMLEECRSPARPDTGAALKA